MKLCWVTDVTKAFRLDREVKISAVTSDFIYILRGHKDITDRVIGGVFLSLQLLGQDLIDKPRKFYIYLITRCHVGVEPSLAKKLPGVYTALPLHQNGKPIHRVVVTC